MKLLQTTKFEYELAEDFNAFFLDEVDKLTRRQDHAYFEWAKELIKGVTQNYEQVLIYNFIKITINDVIEVANYVTESTPPDDCFKTEYQKLLCKNWPIFFCDLIKTCFGIVFPRVHEIDFNPTT